MKVREISKGNPNGTERSHNPTLADAIALLKSFDQKTYNASPQVMGAAERVLGATNFTGLTKEQVADFLGNPAHDEGATCLYSFHNGEMGHMRRFHFDASNRVTKVETILTE